MHKNLMLSGFLGMLLWLIVPLLPENGAALFAQEKFQFGVDPKTVPCCEYDPYQALVWSGKNPKMTIQQFASYVAPVMWFSPDEPLLNDTEGKAIKLPEPLPFEEDPDSAVVYYQLINVLVRDDASGPAYLPDDVDKGNSIIDLQQVAGVDLGFYFYYHAEEGLGGHQHDVEAAEFQITVWPRDQCEECPYALVITKVIARAHGLSWYDNTLVTDQYTKFPMHLMVEEGKHASCTDKNADGYFTPGYDVNKRVNDAWAVRDVIRSGALFTGGFQAWMAKPRRPEHRVFPPLPEDSPLRHRHSDENGVYSPDNAVYLLRPLPPAHLAGEDKGLYHFIESKEVPNWPDLVPNTDLQQFSRWLGSEPFVKSIAINLYADGSPVGFSVAFPFFIVKNLEDPMAGGFVVHRVYFKDKNLRDFGWLIHYTPSASRWFDGYLSAGVEWDVRDLPQGSDKTTETDSDFVLETGIKFRVNLSHSPLKFLTRITDFWGLRAGVKNRGFFDINRLTYVMEFGAGTW